MLAVFVHGLGNNRFSVKVISIMFLRECPLRNIIAHRSLALLYSHEAIFWVPPRESVFQGL